MRANSVDPRSIADLFRRMRPRGPFDDDEPKKNLLVIPIQSRRTNEAKRPSFSIPEFLSTHPDIERRIDRFDKARWTISAGGGVGAGARSTQAAGLKTAGSTLAARS